MKKFLFYFARKPHTLKTVSEWQVEPVFAKASPGRPFDPSCEVLTKREALCEVGFWLRRIARETTAFKLLSASLLSLLCAAPVFAMEHASDASTLGAVNQLAGARNLLTCFPVRLLIESLGRLDRGECILLVGEQGGRLSDVVKKSLPKIREIKAFAKWIGSAEEAEIKQVGTGLTEKGAVVLFREIEVYSFAGQKFEAKPSSWQSATEVGEEVKKWQQWLNSAEENQIRVVGENLKLSKLVVLANGAAESKLNQRIEIVKDDDPKQLEKQLENQLEKMSQEDLDKLLKLVGPLQNVTISSLMGGSNLSANTVVEFGRKIRTVIDPSAQLENMGPEDLEKLLNTEELNELLATINCLKRLSLKLHSKKTIEMSEGEASE